VIKQNIRMGRAKIKAIKGLLECMHDVSYKQNISKSYKQSLINFGELGRDGRVTNRWHILGNPDSHSGFFNPDQGAEFFNWSAQIYDVNNMTNSGEQLGRDFITVCVCVCWWVHVWTRKCREEATSRCCWQVRRHARGCRWQPACQPLQPAALAIATPNLHGQPKTSHTQRSSRIYATHSGHRNSSNDVATDAFISQRRTYDFPTGVGRLRKGVVTIQDCL